MLRSQGGNLTVLWYLIYLKCPDRKLEKLSVHLLAELQYLKSAGRLTAKKICPPLSVKVIVFVQCIKKLDKCFWCKSSQIKLKTNE